MFPLVSYLYNNIIYYMYIPEHKRLGKNNIYIYSNRTSASEDLSRWIHHISVEFWQCGPTGNASAYIGRKNNKNNSIVTSAFAETLRNKKKKSFWHFSFYNVLLYLRLIYTAYAVLFFQKKPYYSLQMSQKYIHYSFQYCVHLQAQYI